MSLFFQGMIEASFFILLLVIGKIDFKQKIIPDRLLLVGTILAVIKIIYTTVIHQFSYIYLIKNLIAAIIVGLLFIATYYLSKKGIGFGDVKFMAVLALFYGLTDTLIIIFVAMFGVAIYGMISTAAKRENYKKQVPFAPFVIAAVIVMFIINYAS